MTEDAAPGNGVVRYTVKELLQDIRLSIAALDGKLDSKADKAEVAVLANRVDGHSEQIKLHDFWFDALNEKSKKATDTRRFRLPLILSAVFNVVSPFIWFAVSHIH